MQFRPPLLGLSVVVFSHHVKAEALLPPSVILDGSLPWQYSSNPGWSSGTKQPDQTLSPYFKLSAFGKFGPELSYQFYGSAGMDRYFSFRDANGSVAAFGGQIGKRGEHVYLAFTYERGLYFDEYFRRPGSVANELGTSVRISYASATDGFAARPAFTAVIRADNAGVAQRTLLSARISFEKTITDRWTALFTPHLRHYEFLNDQKGRRDTIFSFSAGAKYDITRNIAWTTSVGYETRDSTLPTRSFVNYLIGTSIDFSFDLFDDGSRQNRSPLKDALVMPWDKR